MFKTIEKIIKYPRLTQEYPKIKPDSSLVVGRPEISPDKCGSCGKCISRCPSGAISGIEPANALSVAVPGADTDNVTDRATDKAGHGKIMIDYDRCIFCALCEEICPEGAVRMTHEYELARKNGAVPGKGGITVNPGIAGDDPTHGLSQEELEGRLKKRISKLFGRSLQIREVDAGSCNGCDYEINALNNPFNDIERLGIHFVASPRHADMLLVTGPVSRNMEEALLKTYNAAPDPKLVVAVGTCACSGGIFRECYAAGKGIDSVIPVDVYVPGCPPRPQAILYGILKALDRV